MPTNAEPSSPQPDEHTLVSSERSRAPIAKSAARIRGLDDILHGGFPVGRTTLISGGSGTGKTVLAMEFLCRGALQGEAGLFVSFEERAEDVRANAASIGLDVAALEDAGKLRAIHARIPHGAVHSGQFDIQGLLAILEGNARTLGTKRVVLDAVDMLMRLFGEPGREREELHILNDWLQDRGYTTILTVKAGPEGEQVYPFLDYMADCVLSLDQRFRGQVRTRRMRVVKYRGSDFLSNEYPYVFTACGVVVMPISMASLTQQGTGALVSTGVEDLDTVMAGGFMKGSCVLVAGPSGSGKTTLVCSFANEACRRGEKVVYVSYEESVDSISREMLNVGVDLRPALDNGAMIALTSIPESTGAEQHLLKIRDAMDELKPGHVVVDSISACERMGGSEAAFGFLVRLIATCKEQGVTCLLTNQTRPGEMPLQISGFGISSLVDAVIALDLCDDDERLRRRLTAVKARGMKHSMAHHEMRITDRGIELDLSNLQAGVG